MEEELSSLQSLDRNELRRRLTTLTGRPAPNVSAALLRLAVAWEMQAKVHGGIPRQTLQKLEQIARGKTRTNASTPGMKLLRVWEGRTHVVEVCEDGIIRWDKREWRSLSEVARSITGTRWSGPAFFGLKQKRAG